MDTIDEIRDLLETAGYGMKTAKMATSVGAERKFPLMTLGERLSSFDEESREAGAVVFEALAHVKDSYYELVGILIQEHFEGVSFELRFWSAFEWINGRLFSDRVSDKSQQLLRQELTEALRLTVGLLDRLALLSPSGDKQLTWAGTFK